MSLYAPSLADDPAARWWKRFERAAATPHAARGLLAMLGDSDLTPHLADIRAPTLVLPEGTALCCGRHASCLAHPFRARRTLSKAPVLYCAAADR
jgi:hypothetical protein